MKWIFPDCDHGINTCRHELLTRDEEKITNIVIYLQCYQYLQAWTVKANVGDREIRTVSCKRLSAMTVSNYHFVDPV